MIQHKYKSVTGVAWKDAAMKSRQLFSEAGQLDEMAYSFLKRETLSPETWREFSAAKRKAEKKYGEACQERQHIKKILSALDAHTGKHDTSGLENLRTAS
jgi:hypothetical protein